MHHFFTFIICAVVSLLGSDSREASANVWCCMCMQSIIDSGGPLSGLFKAASALVQLGVPLFIKECGFDLVNS